MGVQMQQRLIMIQMLIRMMIRVFRLYMVVQIQQRLIMIQMLIPLMVHVVMLMATDNTALIMMRKHKDNGSCIAYVFGCIDETACNYDYADANTSDNSCTYAATYCDCNDVCLNDSDGDGVRDELEIAGWYRLIIFRI